LMLLRNRAIHVSNPPEAGKPQSTGETGRQERHE
jgi:hypothetical protein